jgi:hypothetical protein
MGYYRSLVTGLLSGSDQQTTHDAEHIGAFGAPCIYLIIEPARRKAESVCFHDFFFEWLSFWAQRSRS